MKKAILTVLFSACALWGCEALPLDSWYEDIIGKDDAPAAAADPAVEEEAPPVEVEENPAVEEEEEEAPRGAADAIDYKKIQWNDYDIGDWAVEKEPFGVSVDERYIRWTFDQSRWPGDREGINGNIFFIWEENGRLYGESFEHIRSRAKLIGANEVKGGGKLRSKPESWRPTEGRKYWLVMSSHVRGWEKTRRRTNIEKIRWKR